MHYRDSELVQHALVWGMESIAWMIRCSTESDPEHAEELRDLLRQMKRYHDRRFGEMCEPTEGVPLIDAMTRKLVGDK